PDALAVYHLIARWMTAYLMASHPHLGRPGEVCPFTSRAYRLDTIRIGVSLAAGDDVPVIKKDMQECLRQFSEIACDETTRHFCSFVLGLPILEAADGLASLGAAQNDLKLRCLWRGLMVGRFLPASEDQGLWTRDFRPMRSPIPLLAI